MNYSVSENLETIFSPQPATITNLVYHKITDHIEAPLQHQAISLLNLPFNDSTPSKTLASTKQQNNRCKVPKVCRVCFKCVIELRRHLEQCHKELGHLQVLKIVAESKRFRKDLKKSPSKAVRNVLLCPYTNDSGEICNRPIVEYKLYQHLKFYHHIQPKSAEGIRLVQQARANPFASKSIFSEYCESITDNSNNSESQISLLSLQNETDTIESVIDTNTYTVSPINTPPQSPQFITIPSSVILPQSVVPTILTGNKCQVLSICLNVVVSPNNLPPIIVPQELLTLNSKQDNESMYFYLQ